MEPSQVQDYLTKFIEYAETVSEKEACGLVINDTFIACKNVSLDRDTFIIDPIDYARATRQGTIQFICHSHLIGSSKATEADTYSCNKGKVPWFIYSKVDKTHSILFPTDYKHPYLGRPYYFGTLDCWGLVADVLLEEKGIKVGRPLVTEEDWFTHKVNLFEQYADDNGFDKVIDNSLRKYDVLLFRVGNSKVPNHSGIMYDKNTFLHHTAKRLSSQEIYGGYWAKYTVASYRHRELK